MRHLALLALRATAVVAVVLAGCGGSTGADVAGPTTEAAPTTTFLAYTSDPQDYIGGGATRRYAYTAGTWTARLDTAFVIDPLRASHLRVTFQSLTDPNSNWQIDLEPPKGTPLSVGTYESAEGWPFETLTAPGLSFEGSGRGCNKATGRFTITYLEPGPSGAINGLHATFEQHCEGGSPALRGEIAVAANPWR